VAARLFSALCRPNSVVIERRFGPAFLVSLAAHAAMAALLVLATHSTRASHQDSSKTLETTDIRMVWLNKPGPGGGGGGGGNQMKEPPRRAELPGHDARTVPATKPTAVESPTPAPPDREPAPQVVIPVETLALGTQILPGAMDAPPAAPTRSQGAGKDDGAGTGDRGGDGRGRGRGFGDGTDAGTDGGFYQPGADVTMPIELRKGMAQYTTEAMRARAQGAITVECVVQTNGVCTNIKVIHAFNPTFGLDQEAIKAAAQWRFHPGMRRGQPVAVLVTMEIAFALR
jgi:TonB family protein